MDIQKPLPPKEENLQASNNRNLAGQKKVAPEDLSIKKRFPSVPMEEVLSVMREKEKRNRLRSFVKAGLGKCRSILVEWMVQVGEAFKLDNVTIHTAVALLDRLLLEIEITRSRLQLIASCCLLLSAKLNETEDMIPSVEELNYCTDNAYTPELIVQMEAIVLNQLHWDLTAVTSSHFLEFFLPYSLNEMDCLNNQSILNLASLQKDVIKSAAFFVDICRQEHQFLDYPPSLIAASSIALTRKILKISPLWSDDLNIATEYEYTDLESCVDHIWGVYKINFLGPTSGT